MNLYNVNAMAIAMNEKEEQEEKTEAKVESVNIALFLREVRTEFSKISWPSREQVTREFFAVLILVSFLTGVIFLIDKAFGIVSGFFTGRI